MSTPTALTDAQVDQLITQIQQRLATTAAPLVNVDNQAVPAATSTGRVQVAQGQVVASAWGNLLWDQSVMNFDTTVQRDQQWPSPHEGAVCYTGDVQGLWLYYGGAWILQGGTPPFTRFASSAGAIASQGSGTLLIVPNETGWWTISGSTVTFLQRGMFALVVAADVGGSSDLAFFTRIMQAGNANRVQNRARTDGSSNYATCTWVGYRNVNDVLISDLVNQTGSPNTFNRHCWLSYLGGA